VKEVSVGEPRWSETETLTLLEICKEVNVNEVSDKMPHKWKRVCEELARQAGTNRSKEMCRNKWGKLKSEYLKWKASQCQTGAGRVSFKYEKEIAEILGDQHHITPKFLLTASGHISASGKENEAPLTSSPLSDSRHGGKENVNKRMSAKVLDFNLNESTAGCSAAPPKCKIMKLSDQKTALMEQHLVLLQKNKESTDALTVAVQNIAAAIENGFANLADAIRYSVDKRDAKNS
jgi:hypothetical protein